MAPKAAEKIELVYDDKCPLCKTYCTNVVLDNPENNLVLVDARQKSALMDDITRKGWDIDEGIVVKVDGKLYYNSEAVHQLGLRARDKKWTGWVNRVFFGSLGVAKIFYPSAKAVRNVLLRVLGIDKIGNLKPEKTLKTQLGDAWHKLDLDVQQRFDKEPEVGETITYEGVMNEIRCSRMGRLFAQLTRIVGNPLTPYSGKDVPMEVSLSKRAGKYGVFWQRTYFFKGRKPYVVTSVKKESSKGEMLECVGGGFGMKLEVYAKDGDMHFESYRYFWSFFGQKILLPHWLSPGKTHVIHHDLGGGKFMFTISMVHGQLGETFFQQGVFHKKG